MDSRLRGNDGLRDFLRDRQNSGRRVGSDQGKCNKDGQKDSSVFVDVASGSNFRNEECHLNLFEQDPIFPNPYSVYVLFSSEWFHIRWNAFTEASQGCIYKRFVSGGEFLILFYCLL